MVVTPQAGASRLRGSGPSEELSFPPDARLKWAMDCMSRWWRMPNVQQGSVASSLMISLSEEDKSETPNTGGHWLQ